MKYKNRPLKELFTEYQAAPNAATKGYIKRELRERTEAIIKALDSVHDEADAKILYRIFTTGL